MKASRHRPADSPGFTILEMMVAMAILAILLLALAEIFQVADSSIKNSGSHLDADGQARMIFDRFAADFASMPKRDDLDYDFVQQAGNDKFFFYSEAPGFLPASATSTVQNTASLIGYEINSSYELERLGYGLNWDRAGASVVHFTFPNAASSFAPDPKSTINDGGSGAWSAVISNDGTTGNFHVLGEMVFRLEFCFLLKDGTYSTSPVLTSAPSTWPSGGAAPIFYVSQSGAPTATSDSSQNYAAGSRWWDSTNNRGYVCLQATVGTAIWRPLGWGDVAGIVVAMALLDDNSRTILTSSGINLGQAASLLVDANSSDLAASPPRLMSATWQATVTSGSFAASAKLPVSVASQVRIYQRCLYLNNLVTQ